LTTPKTTRALLSAGLSLPLELRVHGRGGQGGVTCAKLIAAIYAGIGLQVQTFGDYGSERSGAPIQAYTRVDRMPITNRNKVYHPHHLLLLDPGLMESGVLAGTSPGGLLLINTPASPEAFADSCGHYRIATVDATEIAREQGIGSSSVVIVNSTIVGAYLKVLDLPLEILEATYATLGLSSDLAAAREAYELVQLREADGRNESAATSVPLLRPAVLPIIDHYRDLPTELRTGGWSNQAPRYRDAGAPCNHACPAGNDVLGFIQALKNQGVAAAAEILLRTQPLPAVCGRVCPAPCMQHCNRAAFDGAVNIRSLERWIGDQAMVQTLVATSDNSLNVAVIGGGPAGLSAAWQLARQGHRVTIYERDDGLGGVLRSGIPSFRLPPEILSRDIARILALGVTSCCGHYLAEGELERLANEYDGMVVATGFGAAHRLGIPGEQVPGVIQGLEFLDQLKREHVRLSGRVTVVGGGNTAIDCARSALRCGAESVRLVYRRSRNEMPAIYEEIDEAEREGVRLLPLRQPTVIQGEERVTGLVLAEVELGEPDASGRRHPAVTDRTEQLASDLIFLALGQETEGRLFPASWQRRGSRIFQDDVPLPVWLAGDCATADGTVTHAIGSGRQAALALLAELGTEPAIPEELLPVVAPGQVRFSHFPVAPPRQDRHLQVSACLEGFDEINRGLAGPEEAERCFSCGRCTLCDTCLLYCPEGVIERSSGGYRINGEQCKGCGMCVAECPRSAMEMLLKNGKGLTG